MGHNPCTMVQAIWKELAQPVTSRWLMHPRAFNIRPETVNGNDASIGGSGSVYSYVSKRLGSKYTLYHMIVPSGAGGYAIVAGSRFVQYL